MEEIAVELDCSPDFSSLLVTDPVLALQCFFGPCVPAQYRLRGPFPFRGAREVIMNAVDNTLAGTRAPGLVRASTLLSNTVLLACLVIAILVYFFLESTSFIQRKITLLRH